MPYLLLLAFLWWNTPALAEFRCAGSQGAPTEDLLPPNAAAKSAHVTAAIAGTRRALVLFARFKGESASPVPAWAADIFNPTLPGSFSHFYDTMSFGKLQVRGDVAPRVYESAQPASAYLATDDTTRGQYGQFAQEILAQADQDLDFSQFDDDGPDGMPNSGDDDGAVDAVFIVVETAPDRFLLGPATGVGDLGFKQGMPTGDQALSGRPILLSPQQGTIQQGRSMATAAGAICHEFGHVLGLPDLYNTAFLSKEDAGPEEDSAGVGAWCLMGWGATGWHGDDGPNSLSAWSRAWLGWSTVETVVQASEEIRLTPVGAGGRIVQVPVSDREYYLLEYRTRAATYYDRHLPGEGLLVWHGEWQPGRDPQPAAWVVDLECADGKWQDAGYPLGRQAAAQAGADNLDFWAHDAAYAQAHAGNLGDATDPFDGMRYTAFAPDTNPASRSVHLTDIHVEDGQAVVQVQAAPPLLQVRDLQFVDLNRDGVAVVEEPVQSLFHLVNQGGLPARQIRAVVRSEDPQVYVFGGEVHFGDLEVGHSTYGSPPQEGRYPTVYLLPGFAGAHTAELWLDLYLGETLVQSMRTTLTGISARQTVQEVAVVDSLGNGDGLPQAGEFFTLSLRLADVPAEMLRALHLSLRALDPQVEAFGGSGVLFAADGDLARSTQSPEFLLRAGAAAGTRLGFELSVDGEPYEGWKDTLFVQVAPGPDQTPPRVTWVRAQTTSRGVALYVADRWIQDGSEIHAVQVRVSDPQRQAVVGQVPLVRTADGFEGMWPAPAPGAYLVEAEAEDVAGNVGRSRQFEVTGLPAEGAGPATPAAGLAQIDLPEDPRPAKISTIRAAPGDPRVWYAATPTSLWRTEDQGASWTRTGLMLNNSNWSMSVDPTDPYRLLVAMEGKRILRSDDGGSSWRPVPLPQTLGPLRLLRIDVTQWGRIYGWADFRHLLLTDDEGVSWREVDFAEGDYTPLAHPADPAFMVAYWSVESDVLWYSLDAGEHWGTRSLPRKLGSVRPDPGSPTALYGLSDGGLWHTDDRGATWQPIDTGTAQGIYEVQPHPSRPGLVYILDFQGPCLRTLDGGKTWSRLPAPGSVGQVAFSPADPEQVFLWCVTGSEGFVWYQSEDLGDHLARLNVPEKARLAGTVVFASGGQLCIGTSGANEAGRRLPGLLTSLDQGSTWQWQPAARGYPFTDTFLDAVYVDPNRPEVILAHPSDKAGMLLRSEDGGNTWKGVLSPWQGPATGAPPYPAILADPRQAGVLYAQGGGQVWRSSDYGATWDMRDLSGGDEEDRATLGGLTLDPSNPSYLYTFIAAMGWHSQDAGQTWAPAGAVAPGESMIALAFHPSGTGLYSATTKGLYLSWNQGASWAPVLEPEFGEWNNARFRFDPSNPDHVYLVTSRDLYYSRDAGISWQWLDPGIGGYPWYCDVAVDPSAPWMLYIATTVGLYRMDTRQTDTAVQIDPMVTPRTVSLEQNYPNPFNPSTTIRFSLPQAGEAELSIFNLVGQHMATLVHGMQEAGMHTLVWDGRDGQGGELSSGVYLYRLEVGAFCETRRLVLVK